MHCNCRQLPSTSHLARTETLKTKTGLSILSVMGLSSLRDELTEFERNVLELIGRL